VSESLAGGETPSAKLMLKWIGVVLGLAAVTLVVVGLLLPREWHVEQSVDIDADPAQIHALVVDVEQWPRWMFVPEQDAPDMEVEATGRGVGAEVVWSGGGSSGAITLVEADPAAGVEWDGRIETDEINNHGSIRYETLDSGLVRVTLVDEGTLPPVLGGYFVPVMNAALSQHFGNALGRLEAVAEGR
jgi:uncharacterized membrane protein